MMVRFQSCKFPIPSYFLLVFQKMHQVRSHLQAVEKFSRFISIFFLFLLVFALVVFHLYRFIVVLFQQLLTTLPTLRICLLKVSNSLRSSNRFFFNKLREYIPVVFQSCNTGLHCHFTGVNCRKNRRVNWV